MEMPVRNAQSRKISAPAPQPRDRPATTRGSATRLWPGDAKTDRAMRKPRLRTRQMERAGGRSSAVPNSAVLEAGPYMWPQEPGSFSTSIIAANREAAGRTNRAKPSARLAPLEIRSRQHVTRKTYRAPQIVSAGGHRGPSPLLRRHTTTP